MAVDRFLVPARGGAHRARRLAIGLAAVSVTALLAPATGGDGPGDEPTGRSGMSGAPSLLGSAEALRSASLARFDPESSGELMPVRVLLEDLCSLAAAAPPEAWCAAELGRTLLESSIGADRAERRQLLQAGMELADLAPTRELAQSLLRSSCQVAEATIHAHGSARAVGGDLVDASGATAGQRRLLQGLHGQLERDGTDDSAMFVARSQRRAASLAPGSRAPRYVARDTAGNEVRSTDFIGRITLYRVWDARSAASVAAHRRDAALLRKHWDLPFELVGISDGEDRRAHLAGLPARGFGGTQIFDGPIGTELADALATSGQASTSSVGRALSAWHEPVAGSSILVDSRGVIRGRDLGHEELDSLILELVHEHRQLLRQREQGL